jgi:hypothetical protein
MGSVVHEQKMNPGTQEFELPIHTKGVYFLRNWETKAQLKFQLEVLFLLEKGF